MGASNNLKRSAAGTATRRPGLVGGLMQAGLVIFALLGLATACQRAGRGAVGPWRLADPLRYAPAAPRPSNAP